MLLATATKTPSIFSKTALCHTPTLAAAVNAHAPGVESPTTSACDYVGVVATSFGRTDY